MATVDITSTVHLTPQVLASAFWQMGSHQQVAFFAALALEVRATYDDPSNQWRGQCGPEGEGQWWALGREVSANDKARSMLMAIAAPLYLHTLRATEGQPDPFVADRLRAQRNRLAVHLEDLLGMTDEPPEPNCSCFIAPPCSDCEQHAGLREVIANAQDALASVREGGAA